MRWTYYVWPSPHVVSGVVDVPLRKGDLKLFSQGRPPREGGWFSLSELPSRKNGFSSCWEVPSRKEDFIRLDFPSPRVVGGVVDVPLREVVFGLFSGIPPREVDVPSE